MSRYFNCICKLFDLIQKTMYNYTENIDGECEELQTMMNKVSQNNNKAAIIIKNLHGETYAKSKE